ncbi:MAG: hypothetical protein MUC50_24380, partial [Myxococcota bacterium]|nr:hypothetical protein [Myxococcota bacterium]
VFRLLALPSHLLVLHSAGQNYPSWWTTSAGALHTSLDGLTPREYCNRSEKDQTRNRLSL